ncbi:MAG: hypothetical protein WEA77_00455 [Hyphomonas sp.]|uniref:hypothetical protein n=1 Tax=Hyphomonas sp. TaxID=87 RepID=UPI00349FDBAF
MTRGALPIGLFFSGAAPALAAESFALKPGQWDTNRSTVIGGAEDTASTARCITSETPPLGPADLAALVEPAGICEILDTAFENDLSLVEALCTGGAIGRASLLVIPGEDAFAIFSDADFVSADGASAHGTVNVESHFAGTCAAP